jgi:hypothetical protein
MMDDFEKKKVYLIESRFRGDHKVHNFASLVFLYVNWFLKYQQFTIGNQLEGVEITRRNVHVAREGWDHTKLQSSDSYIIFYSVIVQGCRDLLWLVDPIQ